MDRAQYFRAGVESHPCVDDAGDAAEQKTDVALGYQAGRIRVKLTDYSDQPGFGSHLVTATVTRPDGSRAQTALGEEALANWRAPSMRRSPAPTTSR